MLALTNTVPGPQTAFIDTYQFGNYSVSQPIAFTAAQGNGISVSHTTLGTNPLRVTLSVDAGFLTLVHPNPNGGIVYRTGDGYQDPTIEFEGTLVDVNTALSWVGYTPPAEQFFQWTTASGGNGHWYQFVTGSKTWTQARDEATAAGGYLATVTSADESTFVNALVYDPAVSFWLGGYQDRTSVTYTEPSGGWRWVTTEPWNYTNWNAGDPNNTGGTEDHLAGNWANSGRWADLQSTNARPGYIIEFEADPRPAPRTQATLTLTTDDLGFAGSRLTDSDTVTINLARQPGFAESPSYSTNPAAVDTTFGTNGVVTVDASAGGIDSIIDMRVMPDGKIVAVGALNNRVGLLRFNTDGTLDTTFGPNGNGGVQVDLGNGVLPIEMQIDLNGRIVVLCKTNTGALSSKLIRFTDVGVLDGSFGTAGIVDLDRAGRSVSGVALQITAENNYAIAFREVQFAIVGVHKAFFAIYDDAGNVIQEISPITNEIGSGIVSRFDGSLLLVSRGGSNGTLLFSDSFRVVNTAYSRHSALTTDFGAGFLVSTSVALSDGRVLVVGSSNTDFFVARLLHDGRLDTAFGTNGVSRVNVLNAADEGWRATVTADGKILVTGYGFNGVNNDVCIIRMSYDGVLDSSFGIGGLFWRNLGGDDRGYAVAALPDGKILIGGQTGNDIAFVRLLGDAINPNGPSNIGLSAATVLESAAIGTAVGTLTATDSTPGDTFTFGLVSGTGSTDNALFSVSGNQLLVNGPLDFETKSSLSVRVRATDASGLWFEKTFSIAVTDTLESPLAPAEQGSSKLADGRLNANEVSTTTTIRVGLGSSGAIAGDTIELLLGGSPFGTAKTQVLSGSDISSGFVTFTVSAADLGADGAKSLTATASNAVGTSAPSGGLAFTLDTVAPAAPGAPVEQGTTNLADGWLTAAEAAAGTTIRVGLAGSGALAGDTVELFIGGVAFSTPKTVTLLASDITNGFVTFSLNGSELGADGSKSLTAIVRDAAGNAGPQSSSLVFTMDTTAPTAPAAPVEQGSSKLSDGFMNLVESSTATTFRVGLGLSGAAAGDTVELLLNGAPFATPKTFPLTSTEITNGYVEFTVTPAEIGPDSPKSLTARVIDLAGNPGVAGSPLAFVKDTAAATAPATPVEQATTKLSDGWLNAAEAATPTTVRVGLGTSGAIAGDRVDLLLAAAAFPTPKSQVLSAADITAGFVDFSVSLTDLGGDGPKSITATVTDIYGESGATPALAFSLDTLAPAAPAVPAEQSSSKLADAFLNVLESSTATMFRVVLGSPGTAAGDTAELLLGGSSFATPKRTVLAGADIANGFVDFSVTRADLGLDGVKTLSARVSDPAGNAAATSGLLTFTLDTIVPSSPLTPAERTTTKLTDGYLNFAESGTPTTIRVGGLVATGAVVGDTLELLLDGSSFPTRKTVTISVAHLFDTFADFTVTTADLGADGAKAITARVISRGGNLGAQSPALSFVKDTGVPTPTTVPVEQGSTKLADGKLNRVESDSSTAIRVALGTSGAVAGDTLELLVSGSSFAPPNQVVLAAGDITTGYVDFVVTNASLGMDGAKTLSARVTDQAGNTGLVSVEFVFIKDTVDPAAPTATTEQGSTKFADGWLNVAEAATSTTVRVALAVGTIANDTLDLLLNGVPLKSVTINPIHILDGFVDFSVTAAELGVDGAKTLSSRVVDQAGNVGLSSAPPVVFTKDLVAPTATAAVAEPFSTKLADGVFKATEAGTLTVFRANYGASGAALGDTVELLLNGASFSTPKMRLLDALNISDTFVDFVVSTADLGADGAKAIAARVTDAAGNPGAIGTALAFVKDTTAPAAPGVPTEQITTKLDDLRLNATEAGTATTFRVSLGTSGAIAGDTVELLLGGAAFATPKMVTLTGTDITNGYVEFTVSGADLGLDGAKSLTARLTDRNSTGPEGPALAFTKDVAAPTAPATPVEQGSTKLTEGWLNAVEAATPTTIRVSLGTSGAAAGDTVELLLGGVSFTTPKTHVLIAGDVTNSYVDFTVSGDDLGADASKSLTAIVTDQAGNIGAASTTLVFTKDTVAPTVTITSSVASLRTGQTATITFTLSEAATDFAAGDVTATGGSLSGFTGSGTSYTATFTPTPNSTANGTISVAANTFTDIAGNANVAGSLAAPIAIDTVAPTAPTLALGPGVSDPVSRTEVLQASGVVTVTGEAGAFITVTFTANGSPVTKTLIGTGVPQAVVITNGATGDLSQLNNGVVSVTATQVDAVGNPQTAPAATMAFTLDKTAGAVVSVTSPAVDGTVVAFQQGIELRVVYNEDVVLDTTNGSPTLALNTAFSGQATFVNQLDSRTLIFRFAPQLGDAAAVLDVASPSALVLNGAVIRDLAGNPAGIQVAQGMLAAKGISVDAAVQASAQGTGSTLATAPSLTASQRRLIVTFNAPVSGLRLSSFKLYYAAPPRRPSDPPSFRLVTLKGASISGSGTTYTLTMPTNLTSLRGIYRVDVGGASSGILSGGIAMTRPTSLFWKRV